MTFTARGLALLAGVFLGCGGSGGQAPESSTQHKALAGLESACESARQPRLVAAPKDEAPEGMVLLEGKDLNCGETYELVVTRPDGTSTSESLTADTQGKVQTTYLVDGPPGELHARLHDSNGEEVAQTLAYSPTFRYGHLTWRTVGPRTAAFSVLNAFSRAYPGSGPDGLAVTGDTFVGTLGDTRLCFGDNTCTDTLTYEVTSYNAAQGWLLARAVNPGQTQPGTGVVVVETEPNDTFGTANSMQLGDDYLSTISDYWGDADYIRFTLSQRTRIEVRTQQLTWMDPSLDLYDSTGRFLASDDNSGGELNSLLTLTLGAGTYYIRAAGSSFDTGQQYVQLRQVALSPPGPITRTYSSDGPFTASISGCCRISSLSNLPYYYTDYLVQTQVRFTPANSSPVSTLAPIVDAPVDTPDFTFQIPATDAEGDQLTFRLATNYESYIDPPPGLTVSSTGLVSWNTVGTWVGELWAAQVIIEERRGGVLIGSSAVDFLLRMTAPGTAPTCLPPSQTGYSVKAGQPVQFTVGTRDVDAWDTLTLTASGVPAGAALQPALPLQGPSGISTTFSWTPSASAVGNTYPVNFTVTDSAGKASQCSVSITVVTPSNWPPVADAGPAQVVPEGSTVTLNGGGSSDPEGQALTYHWSVVGGTGPALTLSSPTSATPSFTASDDGVYTLLLTVTDSGGATGSDTVVVRVDNVAPQVSATGGQVDEGQVFLSEGIITDPGADAWSALVNYGDGSEWQPLALNNGAFTLSHPYTDNGTFQVQIAVRDDDGGQGTVTVQVEVNNVAPWIVDAPGIVIDHGQWLATSVTFGDPGADSWEVWVDYGDGFSDYQVPWGREFFLGYRYRMPGIYSITVTIRDDDGGQVTTAIQVVVYNVVPQVDCCNDWNFRNHEGSWFMASGRYYDPAGGLDTITITVDYGDGTGVQPVNGSDSTNFWFEHIYADNGTYLVTVTVTDGFGGIVTATMQVEVHNVAPQLELQWDWFSILEGSPSQLWVSILDPGQDTWTIQVDYGDGTGLETLESTTRGFQLNHTFSKNGEYLMTFTVTDDEGGVGYFQQWIWVRNVNPEVSLPERGEGLEGSVFHSAGSFTDPGADTWTAWVNYGDGSAEPLALNGKSFELEHVYAYSGTFWVTISVQDSDGGWGEAYMLVTVHNVAPEVNLTGGEGFEAQLFVSTGSFTDVGAESYRWGAQVDYGDGGGWQTLWLEGNSFTLSHVYGDSGVYQVTVQVIDGDGGVGTATAQVVVHNVVPVVTIHADAASEGDLVPMGASIDAWWDIIISAYVDYGDGSPVEQIHPSPWGGSWPLPHTYADNGTYLVTVTVMDDDGGIGTATLLLEVENVAPRLDRFVGNSGTLEGSTYTARGWVRETSADTWTATVDFGDGSPPERIFPTPGSPNTFDLSHVYDDSGVYWVNITLTDEDGGTRIETRWTWVLNVAPTVTAANDSPRYWGTPVSLVGTAVDPSQADTRAGFISLWTLGDGTTASGLTTAHVYAAPGTYQALLTVKDKDYNSWDGGTGRASTTVTIQRRPGAVTCADMTAVYGTPVALGASFLDGLPGGLPGGKSLSFRLGASTDLGVASTDAMGQAHVQSPGELMPGRYVLTVSFAGDSRYSAAEARCTLSVTQSNGTITGGSLHFANNSRGGFNVMLAEGGALKGELQFQSDSTSFHAHTMTALGLSVDKRRGWFAGMGEDGRAFTVYVEDNGEPGSEDVFHLWLDGAPQTGGGALSGGNIQIH
jgi:hypothetical protein